MAGRLWTDKEIKFLKELCKAGKTMPEVQKVFPYRTKNSIEFKASDIGLSLAGPVPEIDMVAFKKIMRGR